MPNPAIPTCQVLDQIVQPVGWRWNPPLPRLLPTTTLQHRPEPPPPPATKSQTWSESTRLLHQMCTRLSQVLAETLNGRRSISQLHDHFDSSSIEAIEVGRTKLKDTEVRLASVHVQPRSGTSAEVTLRLATPQISYAAALRVTQDRDQWRCTGLVLVS